MNNRTKILMLLGFIVAVLSLSVILHFIIANGLPVIGAIGKAWRGQ